MTLILGLNAFHGDASACIVRDGVMVAAAEEERFRRIKHWAGFPSQAIAYCLSQAGARLRDVAHVAVNQDPRATAAQWMSLTPDDWDRIEARVRRSVHAKDDFIRIPFPRIAAASRVTTSFGMTAISRAKS